jgi:hypothetical protein
MNGRFSPGIVFAALSFLPVSCGQYAEGTFPVSGKVLFKGEPAAGAVVTFSPASPSEAGKENALCTGIVDDGGRFHLRYGEKGLGAPAGKYNVFITWRKGEPPSSGDSSSGSGNAKAKKKGETREELRAKKAMPDVLNGRYADSNNPLLHAEVKAETNDLPPFDLIDGPAPVPVEEKKQRRGGGYTVDNG